MRAMAGSGRIRKRLALAIVLTALIPVLAAIFLAEITVRDAAARLFLPETETHLEQSLGVYQELARSVKSGMRHEASLIAAHEPLRSAALGGQRDAVKRELERLIQRHPTLVSLEVKSGDEVLAAADRGRPLDPNQENRLEVSKPLVSPRGGEGAQDDDDDRAAEPEVVAVFATDRARFDELNEMSEFVNRYKSIDELRESHQRGYVLRFAVLLGLTILFAVGVGSLLARDVSRRIGEISRATKSVAAGDLTTRVPAHGNDELTELARAFNRMVGEVEANRARIEYLQRISAWQEMARRLAHEIKNPLTPIQLAVQEIHRRYAGAEADYRKLLDTTLEVVEDEVGTLRRLVGEFSDFARLPQAELERADLGPFLRELSEQSLLRDDEHAPHDEAAQPAISFELPEAGAEVMMDRHMLRRVLINLLRNAAQALAQKGAGGRIVVRLEKKAGAYELSVEDDGPGIPPQLRESVFDPYVTTKTDGTGLGLAIVKKIVIEHGGSITAGESSLGGARLCIRLPLIGPARQSRPEAAA
jgi:two-component system, NtrC family, nitrogen regulation sensor histidine kinase NtrY